MAITTKAEAEALTVEELKAELKARGLPHEGSLLKAGLLDILLEHVDKAANGEPHTTTDNMEETPAVTKSLDTEPAVTRSATENAEASPEADVAAAEAPEKDEEIPVVVATTTAETRAADTESTTTRSAEEVADGTEEPSAKKTKTAPEASPEEPKKMATEESAPASEPTAAA